MSAELARRLIHRGAAPAQVEAALLEAVERGISLVLVVMERYPELVLLLERALDRVDVPALHSVRPLAELTWALPAGMCQRLLALPVRGDPQTESIDVASVDVLDVHVAREFAFQLNMPVRILRAPLQEMARALAGLAGSASVLPGPSATAAHSRTPVIDPAHLGIEDPALEPVLNLGRSKPFSGAGSELGGPPWTVEFETAVAALDSASSPERVVLGLCEGLRPVSALVFAVRADKFEVRGGSAALGNAAELRAISVASGNGNLLDVAARAGFYFGPFAQLLALVSLAGKWAVAPGSDCYARVVNVSERPSLIVLMVGFTPSGVPKRFTESTEVTRRADVLAQSASRALERIVRSRKRG